MKLQIDFDNKIIAVEDTVKLNEFFNKLQLLFPDETWADYSLKVNTEIKWYYWPTYRETVTPNINPYNPSYPIVYYSAGTGDNMKLNPTGIVNVEV